MKGNKVKPPLSTSAAKKSLRQRAGRNLAQPLFDRTGSPKHANQASATNNADTSKTLDNLIMNECHSDELRFLAAMTVM